MNVIRELSRSGDETCSLNGIYFHSKYNPIKEAEKFVSLQNVDFIPSLVFIIEPALSYCADFFKKKFPDSEIIAIRISKKFTDKDNYFHKVIYYENDDLFLKNIDLTYDETKLPYSLISVWEPSAKLFPDETRSILGIFSNLLKKSHSILRTRSFFEKKWIINSINFTKYIRNYVNLEKKGTKPVFICASGPSLKSALPYIKENKNSAYIIALSSAILPLYENGIIPDLCLSTDGGFWANKHLDILSRINFKGILALACEGNCPKKILEKLNILPLSYSDGLESEIAKKSGLKLLEVERCGTVSGTAISLAQNLSSGEIYFFGLDLAYSKGYQHTQNNALEINNKTSDIKINSCETRCVKSEYSGQKDSMKIYENWFSGKIFNTKITRVIDSPQNTLGEIIDRSVMELCLHLDDNKENPHFEQITNNLQEDKIISWINDIKNDEYWLKNAFPVDYLNYIHAKDDSKKSEIYAKILEENTKLIRKI